MSSADARFDPRGFAAVASLLITVGSTLSGADVPPEAAFRAAIGRFYYAALLSARDYLAQSEPMPVNTTEQTHRWVIGKLRESADGESQRLTSELNSMRIVRNRADYGDAIADPRQEALRMASGCSRALGYVTTLTRRYGRS